MSEKKLKNFGVLHLKDLGNLNNVEMRVFSLISKKCSKEICECKKDPTRSPKFHGIDVKEFIESCGLKRSQIFEGISSLVEKEFILKVKVGRKPLFFPVIEKLKGRFGMTQEVEMVKLTKNETKVYAYLSSLQGDKEKSEIPVSMKKIMEMCGMKSIQMVKRTTANLVKKGVVKRVSNYKSASVYHVMRHDETAIFSPKNVTTFSPKNVTNSQDLSPKNVPPLNNSLKDINNSIGNNPLPGGQLNFFEKIPKGYIEDFKKENSTLHIPILESVFFPPVLECRVPITPSVSQNNDTILENFKNKKKDSIQVLENNSKKEGLEKYRKSLMEYISNLSPESIDYMKDQGCGLNRFINIHINEFLKSGLTDFRIVPENIEKISENDKKCLQEYIDKQSSNISDFDYSLLEDAIRFNGFDFTIGVSSRMKLRSLINSIKPKKEKILFKIDGEGERKPW